MNFYNYDELPSSEPTPAPELPVNPVPEPESVNLCDKVSDLVTVGGDLSVPCTIEEFNEVFVKFKAERRACKLELSWTDGVLHASSRV
jgi:hypothetical protein